MAEIQISVLASVSISFIMSKHKHLYIYIYISSSVNVCPYPFSFLGYFLKNHLSILEAFISEKDLAPICDVELLICFPSLSLVF